LKCEWSVFCDKIYIMDDVISARNLSKNESDITTLVLADDHPVVRKALRDAIKKEAGFKIIAEATDGEEAVKLVKELIPDIVIMDIGMPKLSGIEATRQIKAFSPNIIVLALTVYDDIEHVLAILESGADGYLIKNIPVEDIIQSIRLAVDGETVLSPQVFRQVLKYATKYRTKPLLLNPGTKVTTRELEILKLVALGLSNKQIANELCLGTRTVKSHLADIFSKMRVFSRTEAVIVGLRAGFIKLDDLG
jgi:NarL family two-component system response regulator LiaR